jgi:hypothetical protein
MIRNFIASLVSVFVGISCMAPLNTRSAEVSFQWFNLSTNEIWVVEVVGLPAEASAGRLMPSHSEDPLRTKESHFFEPVRIKSRMTIVWQDVGKNGLPGGRKPGELPPPGNEHRFELKRDDLGIPARMTGGKIRFTYLGNEQWRVRLLSEKSK